MIGAILKLLFAALIIGVVIYWIYCLVHWDGTKPCKPEDCDSCPFPPCEDRPINNNERKDQSND